MVGELFLEHLAHARQAIGFPQFAVYLAIIAVIAIIWPLPYDAMHGMAQSDWRSVPYTAAPPNQTEPQQKCVIFHDEEYDHATQT